VLKNVKKQIHFLEKIKIGIGVRVNLFQRKYWLSYPNLTIALNLTLTPIPGKNWNPGFLKFGKM